ncbi:hypothetical protein C8035_v010969 [Colletotrichum spinosum]|uniref:Uncharacterized protein n=1 Tax=Colletotrichum spinosum TaxID=1347390 RepID=A0A4R8Q8X9_9PEZI|nr:hypothetical protein C8035_v010969 [Colletotrichum spinosum]
MEEDGKDRRIYSHEVCYPSPSERTQAGTVHRLQFDINVTARWCCLETGPYPYGYSKVHQMAPKGSTEACLIIGRTLPKSDSWRDEDGGRSTRQPTPRGPSSAG